VRVRKPLRGRARRAWPSGDEIVRLEGLVATGLAGCRIFATGDTADKTGNPEDLA